MSHQMIWKAVEWADVKRQMLCRFPFPLDNTRLHLVLMLRRGSSAKFMPNSSVFPGGVLDEFDFRFPKEKTNFVGGEQSPICLGLADDFALRVCVVRELFEEAGLLPIVEWNGRWERYLANAQEDAHLAEWRRKVKKNP